MFVLKKCKLLLIGVVLLLPSACKTSKKDSTTLDQVIQSSVATVGTTTYNPGHTYVLVVEQPSQNEFLTFIVVNVTTHEIVLKRKFRPGHVRWSDSTTIELLDVPGMIESNKNIEEYIQYVSVTPPSKNKE